MHEFERVSDSPRLPQSLNDVVKETWAPGSPVSDRSGAGIEPPFLDFTPDIYKDQLSELFNNSEQFREMVNTFMDAWKQSGFNPQMMMKFVDMLTQGLDRSTRSGGGGGGPRYAMPASDGGGSYGGGYDGGGNGDSYGGDYSGGGGGFDGMSKATGDQVPGAFSGPLPEGFAGTLAQNAEAALGRQLWAETEFAGVCQNGNVGCAASVSKVLQETGVGYANHAAVLGLADQLRSNGWQDVGGADSAQPGDVIYSDGGGMRQHVGIVGVDGSGRLVIYNNWSNDGQWHADPINQCSILTDYSPDQIHVLRAP